MTKIDMDIFIDPSRIGDSNVRDSIRMVYHKIEASDRPMYFDEIQRDVGKARGYDEHTEATLQWLIENDFVAITERNGITAYDLKERVGIKKSTNNTAV
jgi:hypothetical protein